MIKTTKHRYLSLSGKKQHQKKELLARTMKVDPLLSDTIKDDLLKMHTLTMFERQDWTTRTVMLEHMEQYIFNYFYMTLSNDMELFSLMFPSLSLEEFPKKWRDLYPNLYPEGNTFHAIKICSKEFVSAKERAKTGEKYTKDVSVYTGPKSNHNIVEQSDPKESAVHCHTGRNCGRRFKAGEAIYRCQECGYDDTCVLCFHCFNPKDHENHHVYVDITSQGSHGTCDCGDTEAWLNELHCKAEHYALHGDSEFQEQRKKIKEYGPLFETILRAALDYFIDYFNQNFESMPKFTADITMKLRTYIQTGAVEKKNELLKKIAYKNKYISVDENFMREPKNYCVLVYNDEFHNYSQATSALSQGDPEDSRLEYLTNVIDGEGRAMLRSSTDLSKLLGGFFAVQSNGLSATLNSWAEYIHQETCNYLIMWIKDCLKIEHPEFQSVFRNALCNVFCEEVGFAGYEESNDVSETINELFPDMFSKQADELHQYADLSVLGEGNKLPQGHHLMMGSNYLNSISPHVNPTSEVIKNYKNSRVQFLLYFDNRYWKSLRRNVQDITIPVLSSSNVHRIDFCDQFAEIFTHMINSVCYLDREPQLTALRELILQSFSSHSHAIHMMETGSFLDVIWAIDRIFMNFSVLEDGALLWRRVNVINPSKGFAISFKQGVFSVETLLNKITSSDDLLDSQLFISFVTLFQLFNSAYKIKRKEGEHVLREDQFFISYMEYTMSIYNIIQVFEKILRSHFDEEKLFNAVRLLYTYLIHRVPSYKATVDEFEIIKFKVSKQRVAYMNPVHTFFSVLIEQLPLQKVIQLIEMYDKDFLIVSDYSLRSIVLCAQIDIGYWVRNGVTLLHQSTFYKKNPEICAYPRDIHINQIAFMATQNELPRSIYNMLERWEILDWISGDEGLNNSSYDDKFVPLIQQFIAFVYHLLSERSFYKKYASNEERNKAILKETIIYSLYPKPLYYSKLLEYVPDVLSEQLTEIDECLNDVADFVPPTGLADNGVFKLKENFYSCIDPLKLLNTKDDFEHSISIVEQNMEKINKVAGTEKNAKIIVSPVLEPYENMVEGSRKLGSFTRCDLFSKVLYKLFHYCLANEEYTFLYELLHLVHAIFLDDELANGATSFPDAYIKKPICNHLLSIVQNTKLSDNFKVKADYLLKFMLHKRPAEVQDSLVSCFGEQTFKSLYGQISSYTNNTDGETEMEKKKRQAKARQAKLMNKFKNRQSKFMKANKELYAGTNSQKTKSGLQDDETDTMPDASSVPVEDFSCALCQESETKGDLFVIPVYKSKNPGLRNPSSSGEEYLEEWNGFQNAENNTNFYHHKKQTLHVSCSGSDNAFSSCNHAVHYKCLKKYWKKKHYKKSMFICPVCQTVCNKVLPYIAVENLSHETQKEKLNQIMNSEEQDNYNLLPTFSGTDNLKNNLVHISQFQSDYEDSYFNGKDTKQYIPYILAVQFANTIAMMEISSRLSKGTKHDFLVGKEQTYKTLKNMLLLISALKKVWKDCPNVHLPYSHQIYSSNPNKIFQFIAREMIFTKASLSTILHIVIKQMFYHFQHHGKKRFSSKFIKNLLSSGNECTPNSNVFNLLNIEDSYEMKTLIYTVVLRQLQCILRKVMIFYKVVEMTFTNRISSDSFFKKVELNAVNVPNDVESYCDFMIKMLTGHQNLSDLLKDKKSCVHTKTDQNIDLTRIAYSKCQSVRCSADDCGVAGYELGESLEGEYTGVVKLTNLSEHLNTYITDMHSLKFNTHTMDDEFSKALDDRMDYEICLTCGAKLRSSPDNQYITKHAMKNCFNHYAIFFIPNQNQLRLFLEQPQCCAAMAAPYLNTHGETGKLAMRKGDLTTLSLKRYQHINELWLNMGIPGLTSRLLGDSFRLLITASTAAFANEFGAFRFANILIDDIEQTPASTDLDIESDIEDAVENSTFASEQDDYEGRYVYCTEDESEHEYSEGYSDEDDDGADDDDRAEEDDGAEDDDGAGGWQGPWNPDGNVLYWGHDIPEEFDEYDSNDEVYPNTHQLNTF